MSKQEIKYEIRFRCGCKKLKTKLEKLDLWHLCKRHYITHGLKDNCKCGICRWSIIQANKISQGEQNATQAKFRSLPSGTSLRFLQRSSNDRTRNLGK